MRSCAFLSLLMLSLAAAPAHAEQFRWVASYVAAPGGVSLLHGARLVTIAPDGRHVYVAAVNGLLTFARESSSGALLHLETLRSTDGVPGLSTPTDILATADGRSLYLASPNEGLVAVFRRDRNAGTLTFEGTEALQGATRLEASLDGSRVWVAGANDLVSYVRDSGSGSLSRVGGYETAAVALARSPDGAFLYAANEAREILAFDLAAGDAPLATPVVAGATDGQVQDLGITACGRWLLASVLADDETSQAYSQVFERDRDNGALGESQREDGATRLAVAPVGLRVYFAGPYTPFVLMPNEFFDVEWEPLSGWIPGISRVHDLAVSPDGRHVYLADSGSASIHLLAEPSLREVERRRFFFRQPAPPPFHPEEATALSVTRAGFVTVGGPRDALLLRHLEGLPVLEDLGVEPADAAVITESHDGRFVYFHLSRFERDPVSGALSYRGSTSSPAYGFRISTAIGADDRRFFYSTGSVLLEYVRNPSDGSMSFRTWVDDWFDLDPDGFESIQVFAEVAQIVPSPDLRHVYLLDAGGGGLPPGIAGLSYEPDTGAMAPLQHLPLNASVLAIAPNGRHLYAATEAGLATVARDLETGLLSILPPGASFPGFSSSISHVAISGSGRRLAVWTQDGDLGLFALNAGSGQVSLLARAFVYGPVPSGVLAIDWSGSQVYTLSDGVLRTFVPEPGGSLAVRAVIASLAMLAASRERRRASSAARSSGRRSAPPFPATSAANRS